MSLITVAEGSLRAGFRGKGEDFGTPYCSNELLDKSLIHNEVKNYLDILVPQI